MKKGHYEVRYKNGFIFTDYASNSLNDCIRNIVNSLAFQNEELDEIVFIEY